MFLDSTYMSWHSILVFVIIISLKIIPSSSIHVVTNRKTFILFYGWVVFRCVCVCVCVCVCLLVAQSCPTLCDPMGCSPPGSSVHGILQVRILEWAAIPFSRASSQSRDQTQVSCIAGRFFTSVEKGMFTYSNILTWRFPWTEESEGLRSMGWQRVRHDW